MTVPVYDIPQSPILIVGFLGIMFTLVLLYFVNRDYFGSPLNEDRRKYWQFVLIQAYPRLSQDQRRLVKVNQSIQYLHRQVVTKERKNIEVRVDEYINY